MQNSLQFFFPVEQVSNRIHPRKAVDIYSLGDEEDFNYTNERLMVSLMLIFLICNDRINGQDRCMHMYKIVQLNTIHIKKQSLLIKMPLEQISNLLFLFSVWCFLNFFLNLVFFFFLLSLWSFL